MGWLKRDIWKAGFALASMLLLLILMVWVPVSAAGAYEGASGLATPATGTVQATPTEDATVTALNKEKLAQEVQQLKNQNEPDPLGWLRTNASILLSTLVVVLGGLFGLWRWSVDRRDAQDKELKDRKDERDRRDEEQQRWLKDQEAEREKRAEDQRIEREKRREILVQRYLFQLQDALETLYYRLQNLAERGGRAYMRKVYGSDEYFNESTLYALGRVLAIERIFALEAVYPQLEDTYPGSRLGEFLKKHRIDLQLQHTHFHQYNRLSLAEAVMEHEGDLFRPSTYLEFRRRYEAKDSLEKQWLAPASDAILSLDTDKPRMEALLATLKKTAKYIADKTGIDSSLVRD